MPKCKNRSESDKVVITSVKLRIWRHKPIPFEFLNRKRAILCLFPYGAEGSEVCKNIQKVVNSPWGGYGGEVPNVVPDLNA